MIEAIVTNVTTAISKTTGDDIVIHDLFTMQGEFIKVWSDKILAKTGDEVFTVSNVEEYNGKTRQSHVIVPEAFAKKFLEVNK
jgi:hypothetical protein